MKITQSLARIAKAISGAFAAALAAYLPLVATGTHHITSGGWVAVAFAFLGGLAVVYVTPNSPTANVITELDSRLGDVEDQLPTIPHISRAVVNGVVAGLQTLGHIVQTPMADRTKVPVQADPAPEETGETILASVADVPSPLSPEKTI